MTANQAFPTQPSHKKSKFVQMKNKHEVDAGLAPFAEVVFLNSRRPVLDSSLFHFLSEFLLSYPLNQGIKA